MIILCRHGNTFTNDQTPVMCGARTDLPLTPEGVTQGVRLGQYLRDVLEFTPSKIISGPLLRTRQTAEAIGYGLPVQIDPRLTEIDYGKWEGLSHEQIIAAGDGPALTAWENEGGPPPEEIGWQPALPKLLCELEGILADLEDGTLVVTSNGILRLIYQLLTHQAPGPKAKVGTGRYCQLALTPMGLELVNWNQTPA